MNALTKPTQLATSASLHIALLEVPHAEADAYRAPPLFPAADHAGTFGLSLSIDHLARTVPSSIMRRMVVLSLWPASTAAAAATAATAAATTAFALSPLSPTLTLEWSVTLHRGCLGATLPLFCCCLRLA